MSTNNEPPLSAKDLPAPKPKPNSDVAELIKLLQPAVKAAAAIQPPNKWPGLKVKNKLEACLRILTDETTST